MAMPEIGLGNDLLGKVAEALEINPDLVRRIVLDIERHLLIVAYVEQYVSDKVFEIDWSGLAGGAIVREHVEAGK